MILKQIIVETMNAIIFLSPFSESENIARVQHTNNSLHKTIWPVLFVAALIIGVSSFFVFKITPSTFTENDELWLIYEPSNFIIFPFTMWKTTIFSNVKLNEDSKFIIARNNLQNIADQILIFMISSFPLWRVQTSLFFFVNYYSQ